MRNITLIFILFCGFTQAGTPPIILPAIGCDLFQEPIPYETLTKTPLPPSMIESDTILIGPFGIAISDSQGATVSFFRASPTAVTFLYRVTVGAGPSSLISADFNNDGNLDIAVANTTDNTVAILENTGKNTAFDLTHVCPTGTLGPNSIAAGDFNHDGLLDIVTANSQTDSVFILLGQAQ